MSTRDDAGTEASSEAGADHDNAAQEVVAVDADDTPTGTVNRLAAHTGEGVRHRAFTCLVFDASDRLLLARRAAEKRLWDTHWDGTVASHPTEGQSQIDAAAQRLTEELGVGPARYDDLRVTDRFEYRRHYENAGLEWEVCAVLKMTLDEPAPSLDPDPAEIGGLLWVDYDELFEHPRHYRQLRLCPWFEIAMRRDLGDATATEPSLSPSS